MAVVVRNDDDGISVFPVDVFNQFQNILGGIVIKGAGWLIRRAADPDS
mgnify:CR=1 FL=1